MDKRTFPVLYPLGKPFLSLVLIMLSLTLFGRDDHEKYPENPYADHFQEAYLWNPHIPEGLLEAVAFKMSRFQHLSDTLYESCHGMPRNYGVMGLVDNGKGVFRTNLDLVDNLTGFSKQEIKNDPRKHILAFAYSFRKIRDSLGIKSHRPEDLVPVLVLLSELPNNGLLNDYAMSTRIYGILNTLNDPEFQNTYGLPTRKLDLQSVFGPQNYEVLSSSYVNAGNSKIQNQNGVTFQQGQLKSPDYPPGIWDPAPSCNYSSRNGTPISAVTVHTMQGTYSGAISWAKNCNSNVSFHYAVRSSDGQVTQLVYESDKAWHVGSENPYTIGIEHEGYISDPTWLTTALYQSSADIVRDICNSGYGINPLRTHDGPACNGSSSSCQLGSCIRIKGHQHYPNQTHTDPGPYYDWEYYYRLINNNPPVTNYTQSSGTFYDSGGPTGNYGDDERMLYLIDPGSVSKITLTVNSFHIENGWDSLYVYDGNTINAPLIGGYSGTTIPNTITSSGSSLLIEFRSDCATNESGWEFSWSSTPLDDLPPTTTVDTITDWVTKDFTSTFTDSDSGSSGLEKSFYQVIDYNGTEWRANDLNGFFSDNFSTSTIHPDWTSVSGTWVESGGSLNQTDETLGNTNIHAPLTQSLSNRYLYHWTASINGSGTNKRAGFHFFCDQPDSTNRGNSYFIWFREDDNAVQLYKVTNNSWGSGPVKETPYPFNAGQWYDFKLTYDRITGNIRSYVDDSLVLEWTDPSPIDTGSYISFRSGNSNYIINKLKVYRSRYPSVNVTVGPDSTNDIRYQNPNPSTPAAKVKSIVQDGVGNLSDISQLPLNVDWTPPTVGQVQDGSGNDIDTIVNGNSLSANWSGSSDPNSGISHYEYSMDSIPGDSGMVGWTTTNSTNITESGLTLVDSTVYYTNIRVINNADLVSVDSTSDGQLYLLSSNIDDKQELIGELSVFPNPATRGISPTISLRTVRHAQLTFGLYSPTGQKVWEARKELRTGDHRIRLPQQESNGTYFLRIFGEEGKPATLKVIFE